MGYFDVTFSRLIRLVVPVALRQAVHLAWLNVLCAPVIYLYSFFVAFRNNNLYVLGHNGQVCKLEGALNDAFDPEGRGIYISDYLFGEYLYAYLRAELRVPRYAFLRSESSHSYVFRFSEIAYSGTFVVNVPTVLGVDEVRMRGLINRYKLPGTMYIIKYF